MEYTILTNDDPATLVSQVNSHLKKDWRLQGGLAVTSIPDRGYVHGLRTVYVQAMVKGV